MNIIEIFLVNKTYNILVLLKNPPFFTRLLIQWEVIPLLVFQFAIFIKSFMTGFSPQLLFNLLCLV